MKRILLTLALAVAALGLFAGQSQAQNWNRGGHPGHGHGGHPGHGYGGYRSGYGTVYHPGYIRPHYGHYHYHPGHFHSYPQYRSSYYYGPPRPYRSGVGIYFGF